MELVLTIYLTSDSFVKHRPQSWQNLPFQTRVDVNDDKLYFPQNRGKWERVVCHLRGSAANHSRGFTQSASDWLEPVLYSVVQYKSKDSHLE